MHRPAPCLCSPPHAPRAGALKLSLVGTTAPTHELAKCLSSVRVAIGTACDVELEALAGGGAFIPAQWQPPDADAFAYLRDWQECPTAGAAVPAAGAAAPADVVAALAQAFAEFPYGASKPVPLAAATPVAFAAPGKLVVTDASGASFTYAITEARWAAAARGGGGRGSRGQGAPGASERQNGPLRQGRRAPVSGSIHHPALLLLHSPSSYPSPPLASLARAEHGGAQRGERARRRCGRRNRRL